MQKVIREEKAKGFTGGGIILFLATLNEVESYALACGLDDADYAVYSSDIRYAARGLGRHNANVAPVLFVTQPKARREFAKIKTYADATCFHYNKKPRALAVWDEALTGAEYAYIEISDLMALPAAFKALTDSERKTLYDLAAASMARPANGFIKIPNDVRDIADRVLNLKAKVAVAARQALEALAKLAGSKAYVGSGVGLQRSLIGIGKPLPKDIGPLFVLDASARLTGRYDDWSAYGIDVAKLDPAVLNYTNLTIRWHDCGAGKTAMRNPKDRRSIYEAIAEAVNAKPTERFLIVMSKEFAPPDEGSRSLVPDELAAMFDNPTMVAVVTWGRHVGTNAYRDYENVIIVGAYGYGERAYDALAIAATGIATGIVGKDQRAAQADAEFMHNVYQAVCRCRVRNRDGGESGTATAYLIMPDTDARRDLIRQAFPSCSIETWTPSAKEKRGKSDLVLQVVLGMMKGRTMVSFADVTMACGGSGASYLTKVNKGGRFKETLATHGIYFGRGYYFRQKVDKLAA